MITNCRQLISLLLLPSNEGNRETFKSRCAAYKSRRCAPRSNAEGLPPLRLPAFIALAALVQAMHYAFLFLNRLYYLHSFPVLRTVWGLAKLKPARHSRPTLLACNPPLFPAHQKSRHGFLIPHKAFRTNRVIFFPLNRPSPKLFNIMLCYMHAAAGSSTHPLRSIAHNYIMLNSPFTS